MIIVVKPQLEVMYHCTEKLKTFKGFDKCWWPEGKIRLESNRACLRPLLENK